MNKYLIESINFLKALEMEHVEYLIIGGVAVNIHGFQRATGDLDIWFNPTNENFQKLLKAFIAQGYDTSDFESNRKPLSEIIIRIPLESIFIELLPFLDGKTHFDEIYQRSDRLDVSGMTVRVISYSDLISSKANVHRAKDLEDIAQLERRKRNEL